MPSHSEHVRTPLGDSIDVATMKLLKVAYDDAKDKNVVSSPLSLMMLLGLFNKGAGPETSAEINRYLGGGDTNQNFDSYKELSVMFSNIDPAHLTVAEKIAVSVDHVLKESFAESAREYQCEFNNIDFKNQNEAIAAINKWSAEKTNGHITEPVNKDNLSRDTVLALFNVIYFNGHWHVPFKTEETKDKDFHVSPDSVVQKPMMHLLKPLFYHESAELDAKMVELPYKEEGFRMVVVLPNEVDGLPKVLNNTVEKGLLSSVFSLRPSNRKVDLDMPKFDIRSKLDFNKLLPKIGLGRMFTERTSGLVKEAVLQVDKAFQEAFIKVNEEGATAGAFTGLVAVRKSKLSVPLPPIKFTVDHPFLYAILHKDKILFAGTYSA